jgi:uncharacterized membrane protein HdeD (DUF308 family)
MATSLTAGVHRANTSSVVISVLMILAGVVAICLPFVAGIALTAVVGWLLLLSGALHLVLAWRTDRAASVLWEILLGLAYGAIGFYLLARPAAGLASLAFAVALYLLVEGFLEFMLALQLRASPGSGWLLLDGAVTLALGVAIWSTWPSSSTWAVGTLVGVSMLFSGITRLMVSRAVRRIAA